MALMESFVPEFNEFSLVISFLVIVAVSEGHGEPSVTFSGLQ